MESLLKQAHQNKNVLEYKDINDAFKDVELTPDEFEWILDFFEKQNVDVLNTSEKRMTDDDFMMTMWKRWRSFEDTDILERGKP